MLQGIVPPMVGAAEMKSPSEKLTEKDFKGSGSDSTFGKALDDKMSSKSQKDVKESPQREMKGREERPAKAEAKKEKEPEVAQTDGKNERRGTVRQQKIKEFMDSFESEFEISPTRLVEAMAELNDTQLQQSPEATAEAVIAQLDLPPEDADKAQAMYAGLLMQLKQIEQPVKTPEFTVGTGMTQQSMQLRIQQSQAKQDMLGSTVDRLNQRFWTNPEAKTVQSPLSNMDAGLMQRMMMDESSFADMAAQEVPLEVPMDMPGTPPPAAGEQLPELPPHLQGQMKEVMSPALLAALAAKKAAGTPQQGPVEQAVPAEAGAELMADFTQALKTPEAAGKSSAQQVLSPNDLQAKLAQAFMRNESQGQSMMQSDQSPQQMLGGEKEVMTEKVAVKSDFSSLMGAEGLHGAPIKGETLRMEAAAPNLAAGPQAPANPAENEAAVKHLMNQAQYLIKRGGGEMKVQMTPEGMGTIHLKVMLQDGKVNLQMSADTQEAKKTIESSLAELKTSLAAHKLSMENVKVDVVNSTSADVATQNQTNMNGQQGRDQARQFWNQFNENFGSQGRRESFAEMPSLKGYANRGRDPLQPIETRTTARKVEGKGTGLNLVA